MRVSPKSLCASVVVFLVLSIPSIAQGIAPASWEAAGTVGYAHVPGVRSSNHFPLGGSATYNFSQVIAGGVEYAYTSLGSENVGGVTASESLQTYGGVGRFSFTEDRQIVPYALFGFGGARLKADASGGGASASASQNGYYFAFGGGATVFVGPNWGLRPELRYERQQFTMTNAGSEQYPPFGQNDIEATVSIFYQFGGGQHAQKHRP